MMEGYEGNLKVEVVDIIANDDHGIVLTQEWGTVSCESVAWTVSEIRPGLRGRSLTERVRQPDTRLAVLSPEAFLVDLEGDRPLAWFLVSFGTGDGAVPSAGTVLALERAFLPSRREPALGAAALAPPVALSLTRVGETEPSVATGGFDPVWPLARWTGRVTASTIVEAPSTTRAAGLVTAAVDSITAVEVAGLRGQGRC